MLAIILLVEIFVMRKCLVLVEDLHQIVSLLRLHLGEVAITVIL